MSRVVGLSHSAQGLGPYVLYVFAMGALGVSATHVASHLTHSIVVTASARNDSVKRAPSRVEKYFAMRAAAVRRIRPTSDIRVAALVRPEIHPAVLAAAMDRTEMASASEHPDYHPSASIPPAPQVAGVACSPDGCHSSANRPESAADTTEVQIATAEGELAKQFTKPSTLGKGLPGDLASTRRQKSQRKFIDASIGNPAIVKYFPGTTTPMYETVRVAETPGDIIRRSLRGMI